MQFIDTHCHLYASEFSNDIDAVINAARKNNICKIFLPNIDPESIQSMHQLAESDKQLFYPMMGLHPCSVKTDYEKQLEIIEHHLLSGYKYYGIGETGIDLYWDKTYLNEQKKSFIQHIIWAKKYRLPLIIHVRESFDEVLEILDTHNDNTLKGIFHCFTGTLEQARHIINYGGFLLGIGGVLTFKSSNLPQVLTNIPIEKIVLETDAPYLAPVPFRGKRNEPAYLFYIAQKLADIYNLSLAETARITSQNANHIFCTS
jgi:TatD DNase family protein